MKKNIKRTFCVISAFSLLGTYSAGAVQLSELQATLPISIEDTVSQYIVGNHFSVSGGNYLPFNIVSSKQYTKIWVRCDSGSNIQAKVTDEQGNTVTGGQVKTIKAGNDDYFYITRENGYTGNYKLCIRGLESTPASGWYHSAQADDWGEIMKVDLDIK